MTSGFPWTAWLFWIGGGLLGLLGVWLLYWSLLQGRSHGRKRCPRCWYDMSGSPGSVEKPGTFTCSECGKFIKRERKLYKTRRRWRWAALALLLCTTGHIGVRFPGIQRDGWIQLIPTNAIIFLDQAVEIPVTKTVNHPILGPWQVRYDLVHQTLEDRITLNAAKDPKWCGLFRWQWWILVRNCRSVLESPSQPNSLNWTFYDQYFYHRILQHAVYLGVVEGAGPLASHAEGLIDALEFSGFSTHRQSFDFVEWDLRLKPQDSSEFRYTIRIVPRDPPAGSLKKWLPTELAVHASRLGHEEHAVWAVHSTGPTESHDVTFDVFISTWPGFGQTPKQNWRHLGSIVGHYLGRTAGVAGRDDPSLGSPPSSRMSY